MCALSAGSRASQVEGVVTVGGWSLEATHVIQYMSAESLRDGFRCCTVKTVRFAVHHGRII